ncbi:hypothetical protein VY88_32665 [Azospirillum thiophilum]|uniref:Uncharacterized protein n=1 Tax=Azospirillum thiophilum TaxID=528244 RepID=A0AAC8ZV46_9PROT|nr:hypothetical protein [Azospirillum thiophilum]ALG72475.1 hypothetical protein AL072_15380 [Azospirillum thiophilum]KJR61434.1 hypothetical protein VY88_32665 [Azospirillum thiophilum]
MRSLTNFAPSTFEERGAAVAFTTPVLAQTRVRKDSRDLLEVLVPNLSEGRGVYVVPWKSLPLAFPMTVHDRMLHDLIAKADGCSPDDIRKAVLEAARCGLAGAGAVAAAEAALQDDEEQRLLINYQLIVEALKAVGLESTEILRIGLTSADGQKLTRGLMMKAAQRMALEPTELYGRIAELAVLMEPIGLATSPKPARLRRLMRDLQGFRDSMIDWATDNVSEAAPIGGFCAEVAEHTVNHARNVMGQLDQAMGAFEPLLRQWETKRPQIRKASSRLSWLLDGWEYLILLWSDALTQDRYTQDMAVHDIFRVIPLLPRDEGRADQSLLADKLTTSQRRSVRAYVDWRSGQLDVDLVMRIETIKGRAA